MRIQSSYNVLFNVTMVALKIGKDGQRLHVVVDGAFSMCKTQSTSLCIIRPVRYVFLNARTCSFLF